MQRTCMGCKSGRSAVNILLRSCQTFGGGDRSASAYAIGYLRGAVDAADHQASGIEHMLRPEMMRRPFGARFKLDAQEIPELAINAVPHFPEELAFGIADPHVG